MKTLALCLSVTASASVSLVASAEVLGVDIQNGYSIRYDRVYESDSGWADINDCTITVLNAKGKVLAKNEVFLSTTPSFCGEIDRNGTAVYSYSTEADSGFREKFCHRSALVGARWSSPVVVDNSFCGH